MTILIKVTGKRHYLGQYSNKPLWVYGQKKALPFKNKITARMTIARLYDENFVEFDDIEMVGVDL